MPIHHLDRPIAFHRRFASVSGSVCAALFLSQLIEECGNHRKCIRHTVRHSPTKSDTARRRLSTKARATKAKLEQEKGAKNSAPVRNVHHAGGDAQFD